MAIVTIYGASGMTVQVTVQGARMQTLASSYAEQIKYALYDGHCTLLDLVAGENNEPMDQDLLVQGAVTTGGAFALSGNYTNLVVGAQAEQDGGKNPFVKPLVIVPPLSSPVTLNGAGMTGSSLSILAGNTAGVSFYAGSYDGKFVSTMGNNLFNAQGQKGDWTVATGDGDDTIIGSDGVNNIRAGDGSNLIQLGAGANFVASEGKDTIDGVENSSDTVTILGGNSIVNLQSNSLVVDAALTGSQISVGVNSTIFGGTGSTVNFTGSTGTIVGTVGDTISAAGDLSVYHGANQSISVSGALSFISGTGNTSINAGSGTIWGANDLNATVDTAGRALFTANQPKTTGDQYIDTSSSKGTLEAWTGAGNNTIIGTSGSDHFVFGTQFAESNGDSFATVTGGSGAANTFGVLAGHNGGDITITDFGSAAGNMFFMYNYRPADADKAIQDLLGTATVTGGNTTIQLDNNMKVTFLGVTDLKASNIVIS